MKYLVALSILAGSLAAADNKDPAPLDANGKPIMGVWVQVAATSYYCYEDNCARAVTGTRTALDMPPQSVRKADCSSYMTSVVTPAVVTTTTTKTVTTTSAPYNKRDVVMTAAPTVEQRAEPVQIRAPATIPAYASFCTEGFPGATPHYSSACNCWSITATTTTLSTSTVTQTSTVTYTAPIQPECAGTGSCKDNTMKVVPCGNTICTCLKDVDGKGACIHDGGCGTDSEPWCSKNSDCHRGQMCTLDACCGNPGVCITMVDKSNCPNPKLARFIFAKRRATVVDDDHPHAEKREEAEQQLDGEDGPAGLAAAAPPPRSSQCALGPCDPTVTGQPPTRRFAKDRGLAAAHAEKRGEAGQPLDGEDGPAGLAAAAPPPRSSQCALGPCDPTVTG